MDKKPKLLDKKKIVMAIAEGINRKILDSTLSKIDYSEVFMESELTKFLSKIFIEEPKLAILAKDDINESLTFCDHIRNNETFKELPIIVVCKPFKDKKISKKINNLKINFFAVPVNNVSIIQCIRQYLDN